MYMCGGVSYVCLQDYIHAFRMLQTGDTTKLEKDVMHVILVLCEQGAKYNDFYAHLARRFCIFHRRFQVRRHSFLCL